MTLGGRFWEVAPGTATIRKRRLPAVQVIWLVIGMAHSERIADEADVKPTRISFVIRSCPRAVKVKMSNYKKKRRPPAKRHKGAK